MCICVCALHFSSCRGNFWRPFLLLNIYDIFKQKIKIKYSSFLPNLPTKCLHCSFTPQSLPSLFSSTSLFGVNFRKFPHATKRLVLKIHNFLGFVFQLCWYYVIVNKCAINNISEKELERKKDSFMFLSQIQGTLKY